jgi:NADPH:quinone reductase-like Zn-dependent oxidoreductase
MKAIVHTGYGAPEKVLGIGEAQRPSPKERQVLVRVAASSVNAGDWRAVYASPAFIRLMGGLRKPRETELGGDVSGVVEEVGPDCPDLHVGDEVYGIRHGAYAEYVAGEHFVAKPHNLSLEEAAAVPIAAVTALQALEKHGRIQSGERVLIHGAGGGVGSFAVQIAKALGAHVTATTSARKLEAVRGLGADVVLDYSESDFTSGSERYDLIVDIGGNPSFRRMRRVLASGGRIILVGAGRGIFAVLPRIIAAYLRRRLGQPIKFFVATGPYGEQLTKLREMIESGRVKPLIEHTYGFDEVPAAIRRGATEDTLGKLVIRVG